MQAAVSSDAQIETTVRNRLRRDPRIDEAAVHVAVKDGVVTLSGTVDRSAERNTAEEAAHQFPGVRGVVNELQVRIPGNALWTDGEIVQVVREGFAQHPDLRDEQIFITVSDGWLTLEGALASCKSCEEAERLVLLSGAVLGVTNKLQVAPPLGQKPEVRGSESGGGRMPPETPAGRRAHRRPLEEGARAPGPIHLLSREGPKAKPVVRPRTTSSGEPLSLGRVPMPPAPELSSAARAFVVNTYWSACGHISSLDHLIARPESKKEGWALELMATIERLRMEAADICCEQVWGASLRSGDAAPSTGAARESEPAPGLDPERSLVDLQERRWHSYLRGGRVEGTHLCAQPKQPA